MSNALLTLFQRQGTPHPLTGVNFFSLAKKGSVLALQGDPVHLFAIDKKSGVRHFLTSTSGPLFFSLSENEHDLAVVSTGETVLYELPEEELARALANHHALVPAFLSGLHQWIEAASACFVKPLPPGEQRTVFAPDVTTLKPGELLVFTKPLHIERHEEEVWLEVLEGSILLFGELQLAITPHKPFFPLTVSLWFQCREGTKVRGIADPVLIRENLWRKAENFFAELFTRALPFCLQERAKAERKQLTDRLEEQKQNVERAIAQMESILEPELPLAPKKTDDALEQALRNIGRWSTIEFSFPRRAQTEQRLEEKLNCICNASQLRMRKVTLTGAWWKEDHGPLLGLYRDSQKPVALLNAFPLHYEIFDKGKKIPIHTGHNLSNTAYMFYVSLDPEIKTGRALLRFCFRQYKTLVSSALFYSLLSGLVAFFFPLATNLLFAHAIPENNLFFLWYLTLGMGLSSIGFLSFYFLQNFALLKLEGLGTHLIQFALWDRLLKLPPQFFRRFSVGNLFWRLGIIDEIRSLVRANAATLSLSGLFSIAQLFIMAFFAPPLAAIAAGFALLGLLVTVFLASVKIALLRESLEIQGHLRGFTTQMICGIGKLRVAGAEKNAFSYWAKIFSANKTLQLKARNIQHFVQVFSIVLPSLTFAAIYAAMIEIKSISLPHFLAFQVALGMFMQAVYPLNHTILQLIRILPLWERTKVILEEPLEEDKRKSDPGTLEGDILVDSVVFGYDPTRPPVLNNISLHIGQRELVAIVGPSGSGKSTLIRLILGFEKPSSGGIYYDKKDLTTLDPSAVRKQLGVVLEGEGLVAGQLYDNLVSGGRFSPEQIEEALKLSGFAQDLPSFPMGLYTYIPFNGATLSGGQKQRLLLARALLVRPSILIFDEATSALDYRTQEAITQKLSALNISRIVVAQRLSTIRNADRIYVLDKGTIVQMGTFAELVGQKGLFAELFARQKL